MTPFPGGQSGGRLGRGGRCVSSPGPFVGHALPDVQPFAVEFPVEAIKLPSLVDGPQPERYGFKPREHVLCRRVLPFS